MGVPQEDRRLLFDWSNRMIGIDDPEYASDRRQQQAMAELYVYVNNLATLRKTDPRDDIVTKLINSEIDGDKPVRCRVRVLHAAAHGRRQRDHP